ncbi:septal ring lytic transglycosylase RlpA family protein [Neorhizobium sp. AL 9.2.2]|uniref:septal ring lytic transglycosylase RlpA family protein n=1 Tax=Neorhizobium sp. AL 9.2.2 TaxID=2712894 RepID=UPI00157170D3|nr:septal ring lytic transglycosylase RlpA family protein [Neorhizobium sp. AL 9.2.2]NSY15943.1 septal ring lytic transglycosylase RlpA family protein [Neorhizobium sp. AL 9.2.2]
MITIRRSTLAVAIAAFALLGTAQANAAPGCGHASWYALSSKTASGERMNAAKLTAAHRSLPFGTRVLVTNKRNGKSVVVRINDRGPFIRGRVIDVSKAAAKDIGMVSSGTAQVCYQIVADTRASSQKISGKGIKDVDG